MSLFLISFGKQRRKDLGETGVEQQCVWCYRTIYYHLIVIQTWFTYFFIPIFSYRNEHRIECPSCTQGFNIQGEEIRAAKRGELRITRTFVTRSNDE
jgi:hypothetical protein